MSRSASLFSLIYFNLEVCKSLVSFWIYVIVTGLSGILYN